MTQTHDYWFLKIVQFEIVKAFDKLNLMYYKNFHFSQPRNSLARGREENRKVIIKSLNQKCPRSS